MSNSITVEIHGSPDIRRAPQFEELEKQLAIYKRALEIQIGNQMQTQRLLSPTAADISYIIKCRIQQAEKELEEQDNA